ncbi:hypothetical protein BKA91DRAFT_139805 [Yarrowia lipolytica]|nr:hypothetical protein BKA91DRAFT_139805 [Yarrowia lipolytica]KAE8171373.1 hypothetical protein BKA90DRAFT_139264 [Yarrowia lipolytica]RMJ00969.1 hypothetical protein BD777DRAFT_121605 [Yarrowia lipolytica]
MSHRLSSSHPKSSMSISSTFPIYNTTLYMPPILLLQPDRFSLNGNTSFTNNKSEATDIFSEPTLPCSLPRMVLLSFYYTTLVVLPLLVATNKNQHNFHNVPSITKQMPPPHSPYRANRSDTSPMSPSTL